jgi:hypothetical protein
MDDSAFRILRCGMNKNKKDSFKKFRSMFMLRNARGTNILNNYSNLAYYASAEINFGPCNFLVVISTLPEAITAL